MQHPDEQPQMVVARVLLAERHEVLTPGHGRIYDLELNLLPGAELLTLFLSIGTMLVFVAIETHNDDRNKRHAGQRKAAEHVDEITYSLGIANKGFL